MIMYKNNIKSFSQFLNENLNNSIENVLYEIARNSNDYDTFLDETNQIRTHTILYRGMMEGDELQNDSFFADFIDHAREYGEWCDGIVVTDKIMHFDNYTFEVLRKQITSLILPNYPQFFDNFNEHKDIFISKLRDIYNPYFKEYKLSDAMHQLNYDEDMVIDFIFNIVFNSTENYEKYAVQKINDFFIPILMYYAKSKGINTISFYGSGFYGSDEFVVGDISRYIKLSDIWKSVKETK